MGLSLKEAWCKVAEWCENPPWLTASDLPSDLDEQTLTVDCDAGELAISNGNSVPLDELGTTSRAVYTAPQQPRGFTWERWEGGDAGGSPSGTQAGWEQSWSGAPVNGIPTHVNGAPTVSGVETDVRYAQPEQGRDDSRLCFWVWNDRPVPIELLDTDGRAESAVTYASCDCPGSIVEERYQNDPGPDNSQGVPFLTVPPGGVVKLTVLIHDPGPDFSGYWLRGREEGDTALFDPVSFQERPTPGPSRFESWNNCDDPYQLGPGESWEPFDLDCVDCGGAGGLDTDDVQALIDASTPDVPDPATAVPVPDNETDTAIRTGTAGTSADYARADHNHPIRRQANPGDPVFTPGGNAVIAQQLFTDRWSTEETYEYGARIRVQQAAGTGWGWVNVPVIAGFQQPQIEIVGTYRFPSTAVQNDDGAGASALGASPRGPFMGQEAHHWSSTRRVYAGYFRRDNPVDMYLELVIRYMRN